MVSNIRFFLQTDMQLTERSRKKLFIQNIFKKERKKLDSLTYVFCSDKYLLKINQAFLNHNYYTDILTFNLSASEKITGEIYISVDRVKENARKIRVKADLEFLRVMFHGVLHLCGYSDKTLYQKQKMRKKEDEYLFQYSMFHVKQ